MHWRPAPEGRHPVAAPRKPLLICYWASFCSQPAMAILAEPGRIPAQVPHIGPACCAGLRAYASARDGSVAPGNVITAINDEPVASLDDRLTVLEKHQPGFCSLAL